MQTRNRQQSWDSKFGLRICKDPALLKHVQMEKDRLRLDRKGRRAVRRALRRRFRRQGMHFHFVGDRLVIQTNIPITWKTPRQRAARDQRIERAARQLASAIGQEAQNYVTPRRQVSAPDPWEYTPSTLMNSTSAS